MHHVTVSESPTFWVLCFLYETPHHGGGKIITRHQVKEDRKHLHKQKGIVSQEPSQVVGFQGIFTPRTPTSRLDSILFTRKAEGR